jgi:hypothetical protein
MKNSRPAAHYNTFVAVITSDNQVRGLAVKLLQWRWAADAQIVSQSS